MKKSEKLKELESVYKLSIETRNFEINQLINRNNFIMLFQGVLLAAVFQNQASKPVVEAIICICGIFVSAFQVALSSGAKYWQEHWELKTEKIEELLRAELGSDKFVALFSKGKNEYIGVDEDNARKRHARYVWLVPVLLCVSYFSIAYKFLLGIIFVVASVLGCFLYELISSIGRSDKSYPAKAIFSVEVTPQDMRKKILKGALVNPANILIYRKYSVSKIPVYVGLTLVLTWSALALHAFGVDFSGLAKGHVIKIDNYREDAESKYRK